MRTNKLLILLIAGLGWLTCGQIKRSTQTNQPAAGNEKHPLRLFTKPYQLSNSDTAYIHALFRKASQYQHADSAIQLYRSLLFQCRKEDYFPGVVTAYNSLAFRCQQTGNFDLSRQYLLEGITYLQEQLYGGYLNNDPKYIQKAYFHLISFYTYLEENQLVIETSQKALVHYNLIDSSLTQDMQQIRLYLAHAYLNTNKFDSASIIYLSLLHDILPATSHNYVQVIYAYMGAGSCAQRIYAERTLGYYDQAEQIATIYGDTSYMIRVLNKKAIHYYESGDFKIARSYATRSQALLQQLSSGFDLSEARFQNDYALAVCLMGEKQPDAALPYSRSALHHAQLFQSPSHLTEALYLLGRNYNRIARYAEAEGHLTTALQLAKERGQQVTMADIYKELGTAYANLGRYDQAYTLTLRYTSLWDSIRNGEIAGRIAEMDNRYKVAEKDKLLAQNKLQIVNQQIKIKNQYILVGVVAAAGFFIILMLILILRKRKHRAEVESLKARITGEEQERTRMAMELHDGIVSRLSIIKTNLCTLPQPSQIPEEQDALQEAIAQLDQGIAELRTTSHNLLPEILKQAGLTAALDTYCRKIKQTGKLDIDFQMIGNLPQLREDFQLNIYRIIQEIVNNILKHSGATTALIQFTVRASRLEVTIDDNGTRAHTGETNKETGIGMHNLQSRLQLLGGSMETERNEGTSVYLSFDLKQYIVPAT